jgi:hypothetical protein
MDKAWIVLDTASKAIYHVVQRWPGLIRVGAIIRPKFSDYRSIINSDDTCLSKGMFDRALLG